MASPSKIHLTVDDTGIVKFKPQNGETAAKASELLQENHDRYHAFFNEEGFHNHIAHHLLTLYGLGAPAEVIEKHYKANASYQRPAAAFQDRIIGDMSNPEHFKKYLGDEKYHRDFLIFFQKEMEVKGWEDVLNEYLFKGDQRADDLLVRMPGFLHPIIHLGFGIEFKQPAIIAEALAQAAVHSTWIGDFLLPAEKAARKSSTKTLPQLFDEIRSDEKLLTSPQWEDGNKIRDGILKRAPQEMISYASQWVVGKEELEKKTAEMINAAIYFTAAAQNPPKQVKFDFYYMHSTNCSIFFPTFNAQSWLSTKSKIRLLEWKGRLDLALYTSRRAPTLKLEEVATYVPKELEAGEAEWKGIFRRICDFEDDGHAAKLIRAVANGEQICKKYEEEDWAKIKGFMWEKIGNMVVDSVEDQGAHWVRDRGMATPISASSSSSPTSNARDLEKQDTQPDTANRSNASLREGPSHPQSLTRRTANRGRFSHPLSHVKTTEAEIVDFDGDSDPYRPVNWPFRKKLVTTLLYGLTTMGSTWASSIYSPAVDQISEQFHVGIEVSLLGLTFFLLGFGLGPLIWAPLSEVAPQERGTAIVGYAFAVVGGPTLGPIAGGAIVSSYLRWRWTEYITGIMMMFFLLLDVLILDESYPPVLLVAKARRLRHETGNWALHARHEEWDVSLQELANKFMKRPFLLLATPICFLVALYASFVYGILYLCLAAIPIQFAEGRHWGPVTSELPFLALLLGMILGGGANIFNNQFYIRKFEANGNKAVPEARLPPMMVGSIFFAAGLFIFGWTSDINIFWIAPLIGLVFMGFGFFTIFQAALNYLIDTFQKYSASAVAANTFLRSIFAAVFPLFNEREVYGGDHMQMLMESCPGKTVVSGVMGFALGGAFGLFMASMQYDTPLATNPNAAAITSLPLRQQLKQGFKDMGTRSFSSAKNFGKVGAIFAGGVLAAPAGPQAAAVGCAGFAAFSAAIDAYMRRPSESD
ncbi:hypothetical protein B7494_g4436 [Chlorociboria aeruginascens]|nr:hypothetical protein B7494_g4436 [Chlorociboria aeruginascens]